MTDFLLALLVKSAVLSAVALAVVVGLRRFASRRVSAAARHTVCVWAFASLTVLPVLSVGLPAWRVAVPPIPPTPFPPSEGEKGGVSGAVVERLSAKPVATDALTPPFSPSEGGKGVGGIGGSETIYLAIATLLLLRIAFGHVTVWRIVRRAKPVGGVTIDGVTVRESSNVSVPCAVGVGRGAVIILPQGFTASASRERLGAVLAHEAAHIRRGDYLSQTLANVVCAAYFVNPFVWLLSRELRSDAEHAADDAVLAGGTVKPSDYAAHLLETVRGLRAGRGVPAFAVTMARRSEVGERIGAVLSANVSRRVRLPLAAMAGLAAGCAFVAGVVAVLAVAEPLLLTQKSYDGGWRQEIAPGVFAEVTQLSIARETAWRADGTPTDYRFGDDREGTIPGGELSGDWLLNDPQDCYKKLFIDYRLHFMSTKPKSDIHFSVGWGTVIGNDRADVHGTISEGDVEWRLIEPATVVSVTESEYRKRSPYSSKTYPWREGIVVKAYYRTPLNRIHDRGLVAVDWLGGLHFPVGPECGASNADGTSLKMAYFRKLPRFFRGYYWVRNAQESHEIFFRNIALAPGARPEIRMTEAQTEWANQWAGYAGWDLLTYIPASKTDCETCEFMFDENGRNRQLVVFAVNSPQGNDRTIYAWDHSTPAKRRRVVVIDKQNNRHVLTGESVTGNSDDFERTFREAVKKHGYKPKGYISWTRYTAKVSASLLANAKGIRLEVF